MNISSPASPTRNPGGWSGLSVYTIGHSTRAQADFIALLRHYGVATLVDVRTMPRSRHNPQFNLEELAVALPAAGMAYVHLPRLGGLRRGLGADSPNTGWRNTSFRAYADYMQTADFTLGLDELHGVALNGAVALMCAEAVPWRCHRSLIADALTIRGVEVREIQSITRTEVHKLTPFAHIQDLDLTYPVSDEEPSANSAAR
jgi:uncharacterized protein (DUF488 family)